VRDADVGDMIGPRARTRAVAIAAMLIGLIMATAVVGYFHVGAVLAAMRPIGVAGFLVVIAAQLALYAPLGLAWWLVTPSEPARRVGVFVWGSAMAEAAANILPFSQLGGVVAANRAAVLGGMSRATAFSSNVVDITMEVAAQAIYTLVGVMLLAHHLGLARRDDPLLLPLLGGVVVSIGLIGGLITAQRRGLRIIGRVLGRMVPTVEHRATAVARSINAAYDKPIRLWACLGVHVIAWFAAALVTWLILAFIGHPLPILSVVAIESLLFAIRNAAFMAPAGLGVQEAAYVLLGPLFGLPAEAALALSLLKRARDFSIGVPMLISWQMVESRRSLRRN
jgi:putative membrane protein